MGKKKIAIDDLARMVQDGFAESKTDTQMQFTQVHRALKAISTEHFGVVYRPEFDDLLDRVHDLEAASAKKKAA